MGRRTRKQNGGVKGNTVSWSDQKLKAFKSDPTSSNIHWALDKERADARWKMRGISMRAGPEIKELTTPAQITCFMTRLSEADSAYRAKITFVNSSFLSTTIPEQISIIGMTSTNPTFTVIFNNKLNMRSTTSIDNINNTHPWFNFLEKNWELLTAGHDGFNGCWARLS